MVFTIQLKRMHILVINRQLQKIIIQNFSLNRNKAMSTAQNPFKLQSDNKKFFTSLPNIQEVQSTSSYMQFETGLNRIKNMNKELQQLAKKREEMMFKDAQMDFIFKKQRPNLTLNDFITSVPGQTNPKDKKFRVRALLKEKKQSIHDFLQKKKQIYLSKMNINIKKEQTIKLSDYIKDEQETLRARKLYFDNDVEFMHKFIEGIKKQAQQAQAAVQNETKIQEGLVSKLNSLQAQTQKLDNLISKDTQTLNNLKLYKEFIDSFYDEQRNWKPFVKKSLQQEEVMFMTENISGLSLKDLDRNEGMELVIRFQPQNLLQIFTSAEQNNIREIQNLHDKEDELQTITKQQLKFKTQLDKYIEDNEAKLNDLLKKNDQKQLECTKLRQLKKNNSSNKISVLDSQNLDIEKITSKVFEIEKEIEGKEVRREGQEQGQKGLKKAMTLIQQQIQKLRQTISSVKQTHPHLIQQIEKQIKQNQKKENILRKQQQAKQQQLKKQREQQKKRNEPHNEMIKGRKDMKKVLIQKKVKKKRQVDVKVDNDEDKYLVEEGKDEDEQ